MPPALRFETTISSEQGICSPFFIRIPMAHAVSRAVLRYLCLLAEYCPLPPQLRGGEQFWRKTPPGATLVQPSPTTDRDRTDSTAQHDGRCRADGAGP